MTNLLKFEFRKLFKQKSFYICTAVMLAMSLVGLLLSKTLASNPEFNMAMPSAKSALLSAVSSSSFTMLCGIFIALFVCTDYDQQTIKNIYSRGFTRTNVYFAKYIVSVISTVIMFAVALIFTYVAGAVMLDGTAAEGNYVGLIAGQLIYCLAYSSFVFAISLILKKVGVSIALAILGPSLIGTVINLADAFLKIENFKIGSYWLDGFIGDLISLATDATRLIVCIVLSLVYAVVFVVAGFFINRKQEN